jgi:hypothetical protein
MGGEGRCSMKRLMTVILVSLLACPLSFSETRQSAERQAPSEAMARQLQEVLAPLAEKAVENRLTAADYATMATALRMTFANWDETGFTKNLENFILSHRERFLEDQNAEQVHEGWMKVKTSLAEGSVVTEGDYARSVQRVTREDKERFLGIVKTQGLSGFHSQLVEQLEARARWAATPCRIGTSDMLRDRFFLDRHRLSLPVHCGTGRLGNRAGSCGNRSGFTGSRLCVMAPVLSKGEPMDAYSKLNLVCGWILACFSVLVAVKLRSRMPPMTVAGFGLSSVALTTFAIRLTKYRHALTRETNELILTLMMGFVLIFVAIGAGLRR